MKIDAATQKSLRELVRRESRSLLQYINQASPWVRFEDQALIDKVRSLTGEETAAIKVLADWMETENVAPPYLGAFPMSFTNFNFVDIRKLMKPLIEEQRQQLAKLEADAAALTNMDARAAVNRLVELNRKHLADLIQLQR